MKVFVALCVIALAAAASAEDLSAEQSAKLRQYSKDCVETTHVDIELVAKARKGDFSSDDAKIDQYFTCMFEKCDFLDADGALKIDVIIKKTSSTASEEEINKVVEACKEVKSEPKDKISKAAFACFWTKTNGKYHILPETE